MRNDLAQLDEQREELLKRLGRTEELFGRMLRRDDPADLRAALRELDKRRAFAQQKLDFLAPQVETAQQQMGFLNQQRHADVEDYFNQPENARIIFAMQNSGEVGRHRAGRMGGATGAQRNSDSRAGKL